LYTWASRLRRPHHGYQTVAIDVIIEADPSIEEERKVESISQNCPDGRHRHHSDPQFQGLRWQPGRWSSSCAGTDVVQHRLCRLRASTSQPVVKFVDVLRMRAHSAMQHYTIRFTTRDTVHNPSITEPIIPT